MSCFVLLYSPVRLTPKDSCCRGPTERSSGAEIIISYGAVFRWEYSGRELFIISKDGALIVHLILVLYYSGNWEYWKCLIEPWRSKGSRWKSEPSLDEALNVYREKVADGVVRLLPIPSGACPVSYQEHRLFRGDEKHGYLVLVGERTGVCQTRQVVHALSLRVFVADKYDAG